MLRLSRLLAGGPGRAMRPLSGGRGSDPGAEDDEEERRSQERLASIRSQYFLPGAGHKVILVQPGRHLDRRLKPEKAAELMEEARALVDSLETWSVVLELQVSLRSTTPEVLFTPGVFEEISERIRARQDASAVFVNWPMLSGLQMASLQRAWAKLVYDRLTLVLQIFRLHARSREARLQVALAELPYLRSRLTGVHVGSLDAGATEGLLGEHSVAGTEMPLRARMQFLEEYEHTLRRRIRQMEEKRDFLRSQRRLSHVPLVTVIGYTNAGKTALIRALTSDQRLRPRDKLFATLDTSNHGALLRNNLRVVFVDTIGFLSDIPTALVSAFRATLRDCMDTDLLVHVMDVSHPHWRQQRDRVRAILRDLRLPARLTESLLEAANKSDRASAETLEEFGQEHPEALVISCETGDGLERLQDAVLDTLQRNCDLTRKRLRVRIGGDVYSWLQREATVEHFEVCADDENKAVVTVLFPPSVLARFQAKFKRAR